MRYQQVGWAVPAVFHRPDTECQSCGTPLEGAVECVKCGTDARFGYVFFRDTKKKPQRERFAVYREVQS